MGRYSRSPSPRRSPERSRKRSRSPVRDRRRSRSPRDGHERARAEKMKMLYGVQDTAAAAAAALAALQAQQALLLQQQQMLQAQSPAALAAQATAAAHEDRKKREIYVGNLHIGQVTGDMIRELFNAMCANFVPNPVTEPPVTNIRMDASGRFCFVEMRTVELTDVAVKLDKTDVCGRLLNVGRPKGWEPPVAPLASAAAADKLSAAQQFAAALSGGVTSVVLLENCVTAEAIRDAEERTGVIEDVGEEAGKCGFVHGIAVPVPPLHVANDAPARVYIRFHDTDSSAKCKKRMDGRMFDDRKISARHVTEMDFQRAAQGEWLS